jgi:hypothetical protein
MSYKTDLEKHYSDVRSRLWGKNRNLNIIIKKPEPPKPEPEPEGLSPQGSVQAIGGVAGPTGLELPSINPSILFDGERSSRNMNSKSYMLIADAVAQAYHIPMEKLLERSRAHSLTVIRQHLWWICQNQYNASPTSIGRAAGYDHSTIIYGIKLHERRLKAMEAAR